MSLGATRGEVCLIKERHRSDGNRGGMWSNGGKARSTKVSKWWW